MRKNLTILLLPILLLGVSSCSSTLDFHVPTQNFQTPEVVGDTVGFRGQMTYTNSTKFLLAKLEQSTIFSSQIDVSTEEGTIKDNVLNFTAGLGLGNAVEVTYRAYSDSPDLLGLKVQILGRDGGKREEGVKLSVFGGYGAAEVDNSNLTASNLNGGTRSYNSTLDVKSYEIGTVVGYRFTSWFLTYLGLNYRGSEAEGNLTSDSYPNQVLRNDAIIRSAQLGFQLNSGEKYVLLEGGFATSIWKGLASRDDYTLGLSVGFAVQ